MKKLMLTIALCVAAAPAAFAQGMGADEKQESGAELKVYVGDKDGKPVDVSGWTATLIIEPKGMARKTIKLDLNQPKEKKDAKNAVDHGGQVVDMEGGFKVELVVEAGHAGHGEKDEDEGLAHFETKMSLDVFACPMRCVPPTDKAGKCAKCGMALKGAPMEFTAVVVFKTKDGAKNAKGFEYPPEIPATYAAAVEKTEVHLKAIKDLIDKGDLEKVHSVAEKISMICKKLPEMAAKDDKADVEKLSRATIDLFKEIDDAADAGKKDETMKVYKKYADNIAGLKKHAKEEHHK